MENHLKNQLAMFQKSLHTENVPTSYNYEELSYHQFNFDKISHNHREFFNALKNVEKQNPHTKMYDNIIANSSTMSNSIITYAQQIVEKINQSQSKDKKFNKILVHSHHFSQSILLSSYIHHVSQKKPVLVSSKNQVEKYWVESVVPEAEVDKVSTFKELINKQKMQINYWQDEKQIQVKDQFFYIIDLFNIHPLDYQPYLLKTIKDLKAKNCLIYCSNLQEEEIIDILGESEEIDWEFLQINSTYPSDIYQGKIEQELLKFLREQSNYPNKQDIVIFHEANSHFLKKLGQTLKKNNISNFEFITGPNEKLNSNTTNIFIVTNYDSLLNWKYSLNKVFYVFDYGLDITFYFDYNYLCYVETHSCATKKQLFKRMSLIGVNRLGKYCFEEDIQEQNQVGYFDDRKTLDIGNYCLRMINYGFSSKFDLSNQNIKDCIHCLQKINIIKKNQSKEYEILVKDIVKHLQTQINPLFCKNIIECKNVKMSHLLIIASTILMTPGSLRQPIKSGEGANDRPSGLWRQTGYLHSSIDAIIRCKIIDTRVSKNTVSRRMTSKRLSRVSESEFQVFGSLFEVIQANRMSFDEMKTQDFIREQLINEKNLFKVFDKIEELVEDFELQQVQFTNFQQINDVMAALLNDFDRGAAVYSGSRRIGYDFKGSKSSIHPHKTSLISLLNERPPFIFLNRILNTKSQTNSKLEILMCNHMPETTFMQIFGALPSNRLSSYGQTQIQFHGISSATYINLWSGLSQQINKFQQTYECLVQPNEEVAMITVHCSKQKQSKLRKQFEELLSKIKKKLIMQTKIANYFASTNVMLGSGGTVKQVIKDKYINMCILGNLDPSVTEEDLYDLVQEFFTLKSITMNPSQEKNPHHISAIIQFMSTKDFYRFKQYYHEIPFMDRLMKVTAIETKPKVSILTSEMYLQLSWCAWKSHTTGIVEFEEQEKAEEAAKSLESAPLDNKKVKVQRKGKKVFIQNMKKVTDEIFIEKALSYIGKIKSVQIQRTPIKETPSIQSHLRSEIKQIFGKNDEVEFEIRKIQKLKNGLRKCQVTFKKIEKLNKLLNDMNQKTGVIGDGRIHLQSWFTHPIMIPNGGLTLYNQLIDDVVKKLPQNIKVTLSNEIYYNGKEYIIAKSNRKQQIDHFKGKINQELQGYDVDLTGFEKNILLSEVGVQNLMDLQQKYICKLIPDFNKKTLMVLSRFENVKKIKQQIKAKVQDKFFYRIPLNQKSFKYFKDHPDKYNCMETQYHLTHLSLEEVGKNILLEGSAHHIQNAFNYLMHIIESLLVQSQEMLNSDVCGICCQQPFRPYRLQQCGHKFCLQCVVDTINSTLGDISMFPVKCPQCLAQLVIDDLNSLLTQEAWRKLISMAVNQYAGKNSETITFCFTAGCKQINFLIGTHFQCDACLSSYCLECKMNYHPGLTCLQAKQGGSAAFEKFMKENNIRKCPNKTCKMPIQRLDGCYRVTCTRCGVSMCFKCEPEKMISYPHYNDCYKHLAQVHGSYW